MLTGGGKISRQGHGIYGSNPSASSLRINEDIVGILGKRPESDIVGDRACYKNLDVRV